MKRYLIAALVLIATFVVCVLVVPGAAFGQGARSGAAEAVEQGGGLQSQLQTRDCVQDCEQPCTQEQPAEQQRLREQEQLQAQQQSAPLTAEPAQDRERLQEQDRTALQDGEEAAVQVQARTNEQEGAGEQVSQAQGTEEDTSLPGLLEQWAVRFMERLKSWFWRG